MFSSFIRRTFGQITIEQTPTHVRIEGVNGLVLGLDVNKQWSTSRIASNMLRLSRSSIILEHFFLPDLLYILNVLLNDVKWTRTPKRTLSTIIELIETKTWLAEVKRTSAEHVDMSQLGKLAIHKPASYQLEFIQHYVRAIKAFRLKGYMLDSAAGSGKTLTQLFLSHLLNPDGKRFFVVPKNSVESVWVTTLEKEWNEDVTGKVWDSISGKPLNTSYKYYIFHYEQLKVLLDFINQHEAELMGSYLGLDESHNFNAKDSDRTNYFLIISAKKCIANVLWASGTPIGKMGTECIPFIKSIDPLFTDSAEDAFRKIYGKDSKRGLDILQHRIGHLKYHIPAITSVNIETNIIPFKIEVPNGERFTMDEISKNLRNYANDRTHFYNEHRARYEADYKLAMETFSKTPVAAKHSSDLKRYEQYIRVIRAGYDPQLHKEEAKFCNHFEKKVIIPTLPSTLKERFRQSKSVVKYVHLKILGEALGLLSRYRSACFTEMVPYMQLPMLIDNAKKKTIIFTSHVDVVQEIGKYLTNEGYSPILIFGDTNKDLFPLVKKFFNDENANPLVATFQSLSTAVPLYCANRIINVNQPFRERIKTQSIARAARKGQDEAVDVFDILLETNGKENISTRNQDIMEWSAEMVKAIMGTSNIDLETMSLESDEIDYLDVYTTLNVAKHECVIENIPAEDLPEPVPPTVIEGKFAFLGEAALESSAIPAIQPLRLTGYSPNVYLPRRGVLQVLEKLKANTEFDVTLDPFESALLMRNGVAIKDSEIVFEIGRDFRKTEEMAKGLTGGKTTDYSWLGVGPINYLDRYGKLIDPTNWQPEVKRTNSRIVTVTGKDVIELYKLISVWPGNFKNQEAFLFSGRERYIEPVELLYRVANTILFEVCEGIEHETLSTESKTETKPEVILETEVPKFLFHGSAFKQNELMPGFKRSGVEVKWDGTESNRYLYVSSDHDTAVILGIASAIEKSFDLRHFNYKHETLEMFIESNDKLEPDDIYKLDVYLYRIRGDFKDGWIRNTNHQNGIDTEYKTDHTVRNIVRCDKVDVRSVLHNWIIHFV